MGLREISAAAADLSVWTAELERNYVETGGEVTPETEALERQIEEATAKLAEMPDALGRWLIAKQNEAKVYGIEKETAARRERAAKRSADFIKARIRAVMDSLGRSKIGGTYYTFRAYDSTTTAVDTDFVEENYREKAEEALRAAGVPAWVTVKLGASKSLVPEGVELPPEFRQTTAPSVRFIKPRAAAAEAEAEAEA